MAFLQENYMTLEGYLVSHGGKSLRDMSIEEGESFAWWFLTRNADSKDIVKLEGKLWRPPSGVEPEVGPWSAKDETEMFDAFRMEATGEIRSREVKA